LILILGTGFLDIEDGDTEVAIVLQGKSYQLPQVGVDEKFLPGNIGNRLGGRCSIRLLIRRSPRPGRRDRSLGPVYFGAMLQADRKIKNPNGRQKIRSIRFISIHLRGADCGSGLQRRLLRPLSAKDT
jgi:hypothetical protein